jgi:beta-glucanase (GH16 family)
MLDKVWITKAVAWSIVSAAPVTLHAVEGPSYAGMTIDYVKHEHWVGDLYGQGYWQVNWIDEFNGSRLNRGHWNVLVGTQAEVNNEQQWYVDEEGVGNNFWVANGSLYIQLQKESRTFDGRTKLYTSGRISTKRKIDRSDGAWEARLVFWAGGGVSGAWPAFWVLGSQVQEHPQPGSSCWPTWGAQEIDIFEYVINPQTVPTESMMTNFITGSACGQAQYHSQIHAVNPYVAHTYRLEFHGGWAKIFIDGQFMRQVSWDTWRNQPFHAILNVAIGGGFSGNAVWQ